MTATTKVNPFIEKDAEYTSWLGGDLWKFKFDNGFGASVVQHDGSYGHELGLWELAVLGPDGRLNYSTPITDDVIGHLDVDGVRALLLAIAELPVES